MSASERRDLFNEVAARRNLSAVIIEKDFWVCWMLFQLFTMPEIRDHLVFKGGTSLSKVYGAIQRFSEDIDLSISEAFLGIPPVKTDELTKTQRQKRFDKIKENYENSVEKTIQPLIEQRIVELIGKPSQGNSWSLSKWPTDPATLIFQYPSASTGTLLYIQPAVRLEFGSGVDPWPNAEHHIRPIAAEVFPDFFVEPTGSVICLDIVRTFWEKVTIIHMINTRANPAQGDRLSRHLYDVAMLFGRPEVRKLSSHTGLLKRAAQHKAAYFPTSGVSYEDCYSGKLVLTPTGSRLADLKSDFDAMQDMLFGETVSFEQILSGMTDLEQAVNELSGGVGNF